MPPAQWIAAFAYAVTRVVLGTAARVYYESLEVRNAGRVPPRGPLLVVANHPASFTDVIVLAQTLPRRLHFLAMAPLFQPWIRGVGLRLCGTLPVYRRDDDPARMGRNDDTFRACHEILDTGGAILIFPEGTSRTDRSIVRVKTGAARLALGQAARGGGAGSVTLLPVGIHFEARAEFRSRIDVTVGRPIDLAPFHEQAANDAPAAVRALTDHVQQTLERLILNLPEMDQAAVVAAIERIYREEARDAFGAAPDLAIARGMAGCVAHFAEVDPERLARSWRRIRNYERRLEALQIEDRAVREMLPPRGRILERGRLVLFGLLGIVPALAGALIHGLPCLLIAWVGSRISDPTRVSGVQIAVGVVLFPALYAALAWAMFTALAWSATGIAVALGASAVLGLHALAYFQWLFHQSRRIRLVLLKLSQRRRVARLRRDRRGIVADCERSWRDYVATHGPAAVTVGREPPSR